MGPGGLKTWGGSARPPAALSPQQRWVSKGLIGMFVFFCFVFFVGSGWRGCEVCLETHTGAISCGWQVANSDLKPLRVQPGPGGQPSEKQGGGGAGRGTTCVTGTTSGGLLCLMSRYHAQYPAESGGKATCRELYVSLVTADSCMLTGDICVTFQTHQTSTTV